MNEHTDRARFQNPDVPRFVDVGKRQWQGIAAHVSVGANEHMGRRRVNVRVCLRAGEPVTQECVIVPASHSAPKLQQINIPLLLCQC